MKKTKEKAEAGNLAQAKSGAFKRNEVEHVCSLGLGG